MKKILIANRGAAAARILRAVRALGLRSVVVYSEADADLPYVRQADESYCIGPAPARASYLNQDLLLEVMARCGADALHPGYGFLSENAQFAGWKWRGIASSARRPSGSTRSAIRRVRVR